MKNELTIIFFLIRMLWMNVYFAIKLS